MSYLSSYFNRSALGWLRNRYPDLDWSADVGDGVEMFLDEAEGVSRG